MKHNRLLKEEKMYPFSDDTYMDFEPIDATGFVSNGILTLDDEEYVADFKLEDEMHFEKTVEKIRIEPKFDNRRLFSEIDDEDASVRIEPSDVEISLFTTVNFEDSEETYGGKEDMEFKVPCNVEVDGNSVFVSPCDEHEANASMIFQSSLQKDIWVIDETKKAEKEEKTKASDDPIAESVKRFLKVKKHLFVRNF